MEPSPALPISQRPYDMHMTWKPLRMPIGRDHSNGQQQAWCSRIAQKLLQPSRRARSPSMCILNESSCYWPSVETMPVMPPCSRSYGQKSFPGTLGTGHTLFKLGLGSMSKDGDSSPLIDARPQQVYVPESHWIELLIGGDPKWLRTTSAA